MATEEKHLPIRLFQKRDNDTRETEGGPDSDPSWVLSDEKLTKHASQISSQFYQSFSDYLDIDLFEYSVPLPVGVKLQEKATAKSHRESIEKVFLDENKNVSSIGFSPRDELLFALKTKEHVKQVGNKLGRPEDNNKGISAISKIEKYKPMIEEELDLKGKLKIKLIPYENALAREHLQTSFINFCGEHGVDVKKCNYSLSSEIYKASNVTQDSLAAIAGFDGVLSIESMPTYEFGPEL